MHGPACASRGQETGLKVGDIFRRHGAAYAASRPLSARRRKVLHAVMRCRTAALGGHLDVCTHCGFERPSYNSCRDRHCPSCQTREQERWIADRMKRVLDTHYFHVVFTLPGALRTAALGHPRLVYDALFASVAETLLQLGQQRLHATLGVTAVLHTWNREILFHPHLHCVVTGGGLALDQKSWRSARQKFLFPVGVARNLFRGKLLARLDQAHRQGKLVVDDWPRLRRSLHNKKWVVYFKRAFGGPQQVLAYLGRYTHRVAISSSRLVAVSDDAVTFRTRGGDTITITPHEFIRRFLLHVLPPGFRKIRHYGLLSPSGIKKLFPRATALLGAVAPQPPRELNYFELRDEVCPRCLVGSFRRSLLPPPFDLPALPRWRDTS